MRNIEIILSSSIAVVFFAAFVVGITQYGSATTGGIIDPISARIMIPFRQELYRRAGAGLAKNESLSKLVLSRSCCQHLDLKNCDISQ